MFSVDSSTVQGVTPPATKPVEAVPADTPPPPHYNSHVQIWMAAMMAAPRTVDAVLNLQTGGGSMTPAT